MIPETLQANVVDDTRLSTEYRLVSATALMLL